MTLKDFEQELHRRGMADALAVLAEMRRHQPIAAPRRHASRPMTADVAADILRLHTTTDLTQCEIARALGVNQGRVNEVVKRGKWL